MLLIVCVLLLFNLDSLRERIEKQAANELSDYSMVTPIEGVTLHIIRTIPSNIRLRVVNDNVVKTGVAGINGGFFWEDKLLSIAVEDDQPVQGTAADYGSGWFNAKYSRGTLVYDKALNRFSIQQVKNVGQIQVSDRAQYWAQGGVSMYLQDDEAAAEALTVEALPFAADSRLRSAIVYDEAGMLNLIVSSTRCTAEQFRLAILTYGESLQLMDGIYLDGDGSSQLLFDEYELLGDGRAVVQMIEFIQ